MRNAIEYVLRDEKIWDGFVDITGPYNANTLNYDDIYRTWLDESTSGIKIPDGCMPTTSSVFTKTKK